MICIITFNFILPHFVKAEAVPEEPPEMPDWFKEKYCKNKSEVQCAESVVDEFKGKDIKEIRKPKKMPTNVSPAGVVAYLLTEYAFADTIQPIEESLLEKIDYLDQMLWEYLDSVGLGSWPDVFETVTDTSIVLTDQLVQAVNEFLDGLRMDNDLSDSSDVTLLLAHEFPYAWQGIQKHIEDRDYVYIPPVKSVQVLDYFFTYHTVFGVDQYEFHYLMSVVHSGGVSVVHNYVPRDSFVQMSSDYGGKQMGVHIYENESLTEHMEKFWESNPDRMLLTSEQFLQGMDIDPFYYPNYIGVRTNEIPNPYGSHLNNPDDLQSIVNTDFGIIEIDNTRYYINNMPNPNYTPDLNPTNPDYIPDTYPVLRPISNPGTEIALIPDITPNMNPNPDPNPNPNPDPNPDPNPNPETPNIPVPPSNDFGEGKGCKELDLEFKSFEMFTNKFPFSIPWDIYRATEALFGKMGDEEPVFKLTFIDGQPEMKLPEMIKDWVPLLRSLILFGFDISIIYALYRWFKGAS